MDIFETIQQRKSVRKYIDKPVENEKIEKVMTAAQSAPSWRNGQCWKFIIITDPKLKKEIVSCTGSFNKSWLGKEHAVIIACGDPEKSGERDNQPYYLVDVAIAMENLVLAATALGLGTCWMGSFQEEKIKALLKIPANIRIVAMSPLGYPAKSEGFVGTIAKKVAGSKKRKPLADVYSVNSWEE